MNSRSSLRLSHFDSGTILRSVSGSDQSTSYDCLPRNQISVRETAIEGTIAATSHRYRHVATKRARRKRRALRMQEEPPN
jgi:hypothetical protein